MSDRTFVSDKTYLAILDAVEAGQSASKIGFALNLSRSAVLGLVHRAKGSDADVQKPENRDGGMPPGWWKDGLGRRRDA